MSQFNKPYLVSHKDNLKIFFKFFLYEIKELSNKANVEIKEAIEFLTNLEK